MGGVRGDPVGDPAGAAVALSRRLNFPAERRIVFGMPLDSATLANRLLQLPDWSGDTSAIRRSVTAPQFLAGIRLVDAVALVAEDLDHHPDIDIRWRTVTFTLSTHSAGGVTDKDLTLAARIDTLTRHHL
ncbi:MAG: 4a-hydroxytetrahydrobiopterin dehydratase [Actinomycetia bacterium]|jgi:4a-hydroxytetrahydrobiopterin dehydratase|nr:4a-hydroxytetrahydrobiopterin dehydratase [Actinomycetes bacterium]MDQ1658243.1 4a-hydroxytetrahydrobiopterin dehydratase [Cryptosporangiaceae bacterium]